MKRLTVVALLAVLAVGARAADAPKPPPPPTGAAPTSQPHTTPAEDAQGFDATKVMPDDQLTALYQRELGPRFKPADFQKLKSAHLLLEEFFAAPTAKERRDLTKEIEAAGVEPNLLGRITRSRMDWPTLEGGSIFYVNEQFGQHKVRYFLGIPQAYDRTKPWPLVVKLPTSNAFEVKPPPSAEEVSQIYTGWMQEELRLHPNALCIMPLLNFDELYGPSYNGMNGAFQPIRHAYERVNLDPARVYLIGHGMAGHATWNLGLHYTTYFSAIAPLAGAATGDWQRMRLMNLRNVLPVVWHDADDEILKVDFSRQIVKAIRGLKLDVEYDETKGQGHAPNPETYERIYQKATARARELYPAEVYLQSNRPDVIFNRTDWVQIYQPVNPGKDRRLLFRHGTGYMIVNEQPWMIQAVRPGRNKVEAVTKNVATVRFYFNDQTTNFREAVTVIVNKKPKFEGMLKPSVDVMLKDQLVLGRGWRYFTAAVDIDLAPPATQPTTRPATKPATRPATVPPPR